MLRGQKDSAVIRNTWVLRSARVNKATYVLPATYMKYNLNKKTQQLIRDENFLHLLYYPVISLPCCLQLRLYLCTSLEWLCNHVL